ncbi:xanthine dehydrogenase family protein molybdopterin-binding subunit [Ferruginibacter sp. HRS2-29]|uniref:xanthine dehydrogenase family protein molybdopterin-binding subunit n=1 Tax=Ferruginibacter sp. HRS2-29 TaxID=2487334 RepID=UPI0020CDF52A|nr:xanthine dehydrogenase family protein molybdopterin-binding subunit [Ferruginibacter sp. HRS2-29]MCP9750548.1 xanthine dehydrogenase family protein molybdopterin-binding subunit [Ferruginibacter sp. HRS2-29]
MGFFDDTISLSAPPEGRVEATAKVTGSGKYSAEYEVASLCHAVLVGSTIPAGIIKSINVGNARQVEGVIDVITHLNRPMVPAFADEAKIKEARFGLPVFHTDKIYFKGQPIAMVIAETLEDATYAASLITAEYAADQFNVDFEKSYKNAELKTAGKDRGTADSWAETPSVVEAEYTIKNEVHNPMEMHATIAHWTAENELKMFDKNQGVNNVQRMFAKLYNIPAEKIHVVSEFVGGGFGSGLRVWPHCLAAVIGAKAVKRPVKLVLTRPQMFTLVGYRPESWQKVKIGADNSGKFTGILHQARHATCVYDNFNEGITRIARLVYNFANLRTESATVPLNLSMPTWMRGPGDCTGDFAIESAIDELSYKLNIDPVQLRLQNLALEKDPDSGKKWSTNFVDECIKLAAEKIQWQNRKAAIGAISDGDWKTGYGMAVGMWNAGRSNASAGIKMLKDGSITVQTAMTDIGTGTGTAMQNIAKDATGISKEKIRIELGNSNLPPAPSQGGSTGLSSISGAVAAAVNALKMKLAGFAAAENDTYKNVVGADIILSDNGISYKTTNQQFVPYSVIWEKNNLQVLEVEASSAPGDERKQLAFCSSAAHFCMVKVNTKTGKIKIEKMVCAADGGTIVNEKAAANQISGAVVGGIGMALMEEQLIDPKLGTAIGNDLAGYHFAVNADAPIVEVIFVNKPDVNSNPSGSKGLGEVGIIGAAAAIANAIYNAIGKRLRDLPITPDKVLMG